MYLVKLKPTLKITLAALFMALAAICQKVLAINYLPFAPFMRISFAGPALIVLSSLLLGPIYGAAVGAGCDIIGFIAFDRSGFAYNPLITTTYALLGFLPFFIFYLARKIKNEKLLFILQSLVMFGLFVAVSIFLFATSSFKVFSTTYSLELWQKVVIVVSLFALGLLLSIFLLIYKHKAPHRMIYNLSFTMFVVEIIVMVLYGTLMKGIVFGFSTYGPILITQVITAFVNIALNTVIISIVLEMFLKRYESYSSDDRESKTL